MQENWHKERQKRARGRLQATTCPDLKYYVVPLARLIATIVPTYNIMNLHAESPGAK